jgi:hypothetical protein
MSGADLRTALQNGQTLATLAQGRGMSVSSLTSTVADAMTGADSSLTTSQASEIAQSMVHGWPPIPPKAPWVGVPAEAIKDPKADDATAVIGVMPEQLRAQVAAPDHDPTSTNSGSTADATDKTDTTSTKDTKDTSRITDGTAGAKPVVPGPTVFGNRAAVAAPGRPTGSVTLGRHNDTTSRLAFTTAANTARNARPVAQANQQTVSAAYHRYNTVTTPALSAEV